MKINNETHLKKFQNKKGAFLSIGVRSTLAQQPYASSGTLVSGSHGPLPDPWLEKLF